MSIPDTELKFVANLKNGKRIIGAIHEADARDGIWLHCDTEGRPILVLWDELASLVHAP